MKRIILPLTMCFISTLGIMNAQNPRAISELSPTAIHSQQATKLPAAFYETKTSPMRETKLGVINSDIFIDLKNINIPSIGAYGSAARPDGTAEFGENLIYTSGPYKNDPNLSIVEDTSEGMATWGFAAHKVSGFSVAEDFVLPMDFDITKIDVYSYQTGSTPPSITGIYMQVWDGDPSGGSASIVWGDLSTNILGNVEDTGIYRVLESDQSNTDRKIQKVTANTTGLSLTAGTYWVEYTLEGSGSSGPWAPAMAVLGETITGNAIQNSGGSWDALVDGTNDDPQGLPFQIYGIANLGNNGCVEINPPYDWLFVEALNITSGSAFSTANDLSLEANESFTLKNITAYLVSEWPINTVDVFYYEDNNGIPGNQIGTESSVTIDQNNAIGSLLTFNVYQLDLTVNPFAFIGQENSATTYWIELSATNTSSTNVFWAGTYDNMVGNPMIQDNNSGWSEYDANFDGLYTWSGDCSPVLGIGSNDLVQFRVYPNPTSDILYIETTQNIESISLFNLLGQKVIYEDIDNNTAEIDVTNLPVGTYILKTSIDGQVETQKIIKK